MAESPSPLAAALPHDPELCPALQALINIALDDLEPDPAQGRKRFDCAALEGLAKSIRECGVLEPILVSPREDGGKHRIIAGERRWRAARIAGLASIPCIVRAGPRPALDQLVENFQREDLDAIAKAEQLRRTMAQTGFDAREVAGRAGLSYPTVLKYLRLADGPQVLRTAVCSGLKVKTDDGEETRQLDWTHALEALRIYSTVFEPADPTEKKQRANMRLESLVRRALSEGWTRARWLACASTLGKERRGAAAARPAPEASGREGPFEPQSLPQEQATASEALPTVPTCADPLVALDVLLREGSPELLREAAHRVHAALGNLDPEALFLRNDHSFLVFLDRLRADAWDAIRRADLIREVDGVLSAVRRVPPSVPACD